MDDINYLDYYDLERYLFNVVSKRYLISDKPQQAHVASLAGWKLGSFP